MFITKSAPKTHSTAGIEGTQLKSASIFNDVAAKNGTWMASDGYNVFFAFDSDGFKFKFGGQSDGEKLVVDKDLLILDLNLVGSIGENDRFLDTIASRLLKVDGYGEVLFEEVAGKQVLAAAAAQIEWFLIEGDDTLGTNQRSVS